MSFVPIDPADLVWMRQDEAATLTDLCTIQRLAGGLDSTGAPSKAAATYATVYSNVACRMVYRRDSMGVEGDAAMLALQREHINLWHLIVPYGTDLRTDDQVIASDGKAYLVLGTSTVRSNNTKLTALVKELGA